MATEVNLESIDGFGVGMDAGIMVGRNRDIQEQYHWVRLALLGEMGWHHQRVKNCECANIPCSQMVLLLIVWSSWLTLSWLIRIPTQVVHGRCLQ